MFKGKVESSVYNIRLLGLKKKKKACVCTYTIGLYIFIKDMKNSVLLKRKSVLVESLGENQVAGGWIRKETCYCIYPHYTS